MNILAGIVLIALGGYILFVSYLWNRKKAYAFMTSEIGVVLIVFGVYAFWL